MRRNHQSLASVLENEVTALILHLKKCKHLPLPPCCTSLLLKTPWDQNLAPCSNPRFKSCPRPNPRRSRVAPPRSLPKDDDASCNNNNPFFDFVKQPRDMIWEGGGTHLDPFSTREIFLSLPSLVRFLSHRGRMRACVYVRRGLTMGAAGAKNTSDVSGRCGVTKGLRGRRGIRQSLNSAFSANPRLVSVSFVSSSHSRGGRGGDRGISEERNVE